jgi:hypothetical protein
VLLVRFMVAVALAVAHPMIILVVALALLV